ncbi:MAG: transglycosylase SLT domain-containing protein [Nanoarchaeota archaeon]
MKKTISIMLMLVLLLSNISIANAQVSSLDLNEPSEDISLYPYAYQPLVVSTYDLVTPSGPGQGNYYPVYVVLRGIKTNPIIDIAKIDRISINLDQSVSKYATSVSHRVPIKQTYSLDNMGYLLVYLNKNAFKNENDVPESIDLNLKANIYYKASAGLGIFQQDILLQELNENDFISDKSRYSFWNGRGYLRLENLDDNKAAISVYDGQGIKIRNLIQLVPGQTSDLINLRRLFFQEQTPLADKFRIEYIKPVSGEKAATIQLYINNKLEYVKRFEREQLYQGSAWYIKEIVSGNIQNKVVLQNSDTNELLTIYKNQKTKYNCELISLDDCTLIPDCGLVNGKCVNKYETSLPSIESANSPSSSQDASVEIKKIKELYDPIYKDHKEIEKQVNSLSKDALKIQANVISGKLNSIANNYLDFMKQNPRSENNPYFSAAQSRLAYSDFGTNSIWQLLDKVYKATDDPAYKNYRDEIQRQLLLILKESTNPVSVSETLTELNSRAYYEVSIQYYENLLNSFSDAKDIDDKDRELAPIAQRRIAEIYQNNLYDLDKAIQAYKLLLNKFAESDYVKLQQYEIQKIITLLEYKKNYDVNTEELIEGSNTISLSLDNIEEYGQSSKAYILVNNNLNSPKYKTGYKLGEGIESLDGWTLDEINAKTARLVKIGETTKAPVTLKLDTEVSLDNVKLKLARTDTKSTILVRIIPGENRAFSQSKFKIHIPIEKRLFQLTPQQIDKEIKLSQNTINSLNGAISKLDKFNMLYMGYCYLTASALFIKANLEGKFGIKARKEVVDKWKDYCTDKVKAYKFNNPEEGTYSSVDRCLRAYNEEIENDVEKAKSIVEQAENNPDLKDNPYKKEAWIKEQITKNEIAQERPSQLTEKYVDDYLTSDFNSLQDKVNYEIGQLSKKCYDDQGKFNANCNLAEFENSYPDEYKKFVSSSSSSDKENAFNAILKRETLTKSYQYRQDYLNKGSSQYKDLEADTAVEKFFNKISTPKLSSKVANGPIPIDKSNIITYDNHLVYLENGNLLASFDLYSDNEATILATNKESSVYYIKKSDVVQEATVVSRPEFSSFALKIALSDEPSSKGRLKAITIDNNHYIQIDKRGVDSSIVSISLWRSKNDYEIGTGSFIDTFDYKECKDKIKRFYDIKELTRSNANIDACDLIKESEQKINEKINQYQPGDSVTLLGSKYLFERSVLEQSSLECADVLSINDCRLLSGACDPVMCPPSRFDLDGRWKVSNVIQTGIAGGIVLGLKNYDPPYELLPVCLTGINAGLKNMRSIFEGYNQCLLDHKKTGQSVGGCSYVRSIGFCKVAWGTATALFNVVGPEKLFSLGAKAVGRGGNEYVANFQENMKRSSEYAKFFTSTYGQGILAAYKGKGTQEIGSVFCESAIYRRLPGQGNIVDQLLKPSVPAQFFATFDESPHALISGERVSTYRIFYNIYAGEDHDIRYLVTLRDEETGKEERASYYELLPKGQTAQKTVNIEAEEGYKEICVIIDGDKRCGFGKVSSEFAISYAQEKMLEQEASKKATNAQECVPIKNVIVDNPDIVKTPLSLLSNGLTETGVIKKCSTVNPGMGTNEQNFWAEHGTCGKDNLGRDLGNCWLDSRTLRYQDKKNIEQLSEELKSYTENLKPNEDVINRLKELKDKKDSYDGDFEVFRKQIGKSNKDALKSELKELETQYYLNDLIKSYIDLKEETIDANLIANIYFRLAESYKSLGDLKFVIENLDRATQEQKAIKETFATNKCKLTPTAEENGYSFICDNVLNKELLTLPGTQVSVKVLLLKSPSKDTRVTEYPDSLKNEVNLEFFRSKDKVPCSTLNIFSRNLVLKEELDEKKCDEIAKVKWIKTDLNLASNTPFEDGDVSLSIVLLKKIVSKDVTPILISEARTPSQYSLKKIDLYKDTIKGAAERYDMSPALIAAIITAESLEYANAVRKTTSFTNYEAEDAVSPSGAAGISQFLIGTARDSGLKVDTYPNRPGNQDYDGDCIQRRDKTEEKQKCLGKNVQLDERFDGEKSIYATAEYLRKYVGKFDWIDYDEKLMIAAYNAGPGYVKMSAKCPGKRMYECPKEESKVYRDGETMNYIAKVSAYKMYYQNNPQVLDADLIAANEENSGQTAQSADLDEESNFEIVGDLEVPMN